MWAEGPDVAIAASIAPTAQVNSVDGGYRVSGQQSSFASGVDHSSWVMVGGLASDGAAPEWMLFLIPPGGYEVRDTWSMAGMRATGSNTIVTDNVFVPSSHVLRVSDLREGNGPGSAVRRRPQLPHSVLLLCAADIRGADAGCGTRGLRARPRMDKDAQDGQRHVGIREDEHASSHGSRRRRPRCR